MKTNILIFFIVVVITTLTVNINNADKVYPKFASSYSISGVLKFPYPGITEPFDSYYDFDKLKSRIDYYNGMTKTYQIAADFGTSYKVAHVTTENFTNRVECFTVNGSSTNPIEIQSVIPQTSNFDLLEENVTCGDTICNKWGKTYETLGLNTTVGFWVTIDGEPFQFKVNGSDIYEYDYFNYAPGPQNESLFEVDKDLECRPMYSPLAEDFHSHNPMKELIDKNDTHVHDMFEEFKANHGKQYEHDLAYEMRKMIFKQNVRYVHSMNRAGHPFKLAINQFGDLTSNEMMKMRGRLHTEKEHLGGILLSREKQFSNAAIPDTFDWRTKGAVTPVKDQAVCGSCWSFGTTGTLEGAYFRKTGQLVSLSEQALVDCSWGFNNYGCDGGLDYHAYQWIMKHSGIPTNDSYGQYLAEDGLCNLENVTKTAVIQDYVRVPQYDADSLKYAIATYGPVSVSIDASVFLQFYSSGVFYDTYCENHVYDLNHNVLAIGYGVSNGEPYWLIKNSWSKYWGEEGYIRLSQKDNNCGVTTAATFVFLKGEVEPSTIFPTSNPKYITTTTSPGNSASIVQSFHWWSTIISIFSVFISLISH